MIIQYIGHGHYTVNTNNKNSLFAKGFDSVLKEAGVQSDVQSTQEPTSQSTDNLENPTVIQKVITFDDIKKLVQIPPQIQEIFDKVKKEFTTQVPYPIPPTRQKDPNINLFLAQESLAVAKNDAISHVKGLWEIIDHLIISPAQRFSDDKSQVELKKTTTKEWEGFDWQGTIEAMSKNPLYERLVPAFKRLQEELSIFTPQTPSKEQLEFNRAFQERMLSPYAYSSAYNTHNLDYKDPMPKSSPHKKYAKDIAYWQEQVEFFKSDAWAKAQNNYIFMSNALYISTRNKKLDSFENMVRFIRSQFDSNGLKDSIYTKTELIKGPKTKENKTKPAGLKDALQV